MREIKFHQIKPGDLIIMRSAVRKTLFFRGGVAVAKSKEGDAWLNQANMAVATTDPQYRLYQLTWEEREREPWKILFANL